MLLREHLLRYQLASTSVGARGCAYSVHRTPLLVLAGWYLRRGSYNTSTNISIFMITQINGQKSKCLGHFFFASVHLCNNSVKIFQDIYFIVQLFFTCFSICFKMPNIIFQTTRLMLTSSKKYI